MLGLDNAGKTSFLMRFTSEPIPGIPPTVAFYIKTVPHFLGFKLNIWDVGGQRSIRSFWRNYFEQTDGLIWVVDSADIGRLEDCRKELFSLLKEERLAGASLLIFANKQDIPGACSLQEISKNLDLPSIQATGRHCAIFACSAWKSPETVQAGFDWVVKDIGTRVYVLD